MNLTRMLIVLLSLCLCGWAFSGLARAEERFGGDEDTMLMFVGEEQPVVTVASRYPESPATAPAIVTVVRRDEIEQYGYRTLAELLASQPGFFMAAGGRGTVPYLRGLRDSILFLYDGVPITTDVTKSFAPLDQELSLAAVERVEIVRGPGSVLWGPDAFAGVVNIVPRRGRMVPGLTTALTGGSGDYQGVNLGWGESRRAWDAYISLHGTRNRYADDLYMRDAEGGGPESATIDASEYAEAVGTLNYSDWFSLTGRWSEFTRRYSMSNVAGDLRWDGAREMPFNFLKFKVSKSFGASHYTLSGFSQESDYLLRDADIERRQHNRMTHLEFLWDCRLLNRGLWTLGGSWRRNMVTDAVVRDGFLPDFLSPDEPLDIPSVDQESFSNTLLSVFSQFRYQWGKAEGWAGMRYDDHSQYRSTVSYSLGFHTPVGDTLRVKVAHGSAFRSPYSSQLFSNQRFEPEAVRTTSLQTDWIPCPEQKHSLTLFHSRLENHLAEDPYGGLSRSSERESYGLEWSSQVQLLKALGLRVGFSWLADTPGGENFHHLLFSFVRPDGSQVQVYEDWDEPLDRGPGWLANLALNWKLLPRHSLQLSARTGGDYDYSYKKGTAEGSYAYPLLVDLGYRCPGFLSGQDNFTLRVTNLLDRDYRQPDVYGPAEGPPLQVTLMWVWRY